MAKRRVASGRSINTAPNPSAGGSVGLAGSKFKIMLGDFNAGGRCDIEDTTADGDAAGHNPDENESAHTISLRGWMVGDAALGIANLGDSAGSVELLLSATRKLSGTMFIESYQIRWKRGRKLVGIALSGRWQGAPVEAPVTPPPE